MQRKPRYYGRIGHLRLVSRFPGLARHSLLDIAFARQEHPLALFLDDPQWLDAPTLDLLDDLLTRSELQHLMLIGAYRDNEVDAAHPLMRKLEAIKSAGGTIQEIKLAPLAQEHLGQLLADALRCEPERGAPLAQLVQEKTGGNPFFTIQFISSLAEEGMLTFDHDTACWSWDLKRNHAKGYTDYVVDLMIGKLIRLPAQTQTALPRRDHDALVFVLGYGWFFVDAFMVMVLAVSYLLLTHRQSHLREPESVGAAAAVQMHKK